MCKQNESNPYVKTTKLRDMHQQALKHTNCTLSFKLDTYLKKQKRARKVVVL